MLTRIRIARIDTTKYPNQVYITGKVKKSK